MRKRFNAAEAAIIAAGVGTRVEWRNVSHWLPGELVATGDVDTFGAPFVVVRNLKGTRTVSRGERIHAYPGSLRAAV